VVWWVLPLTPGGKCHQQNHAEIKKSHAIRTHCQPSVSVEYSTADNVSIFIRVLNIFLLFAFKKKN
jgi:hypothetical protein